MRVQIGNFAADTRVAITFDDDRQLTLTTDRSGSARGAFDVPAAVAGSHEIVAKGGGRAASRPFSVRPRLELSTTSIVAGRSLTVTLSGFEAGKTVKVRLYDVGSSTRYALLGELRTNSQGGASKSLTVPRTSKGGTHKVVAYQTSARNDDANLRVTALTSTPKPTKTATPRPSACANARAWLNGTLDRVGYVGTNRNIAWNLWRSTGITESYARQLANNIYFWADRQDRSQPPAAATTMNDYLVFAFVQYGDSVYWIAEAIEARRNGNYTRSVLAELQANQDYADGDAAIHRADELLVVFRNRCGL